MSAVGFTYNPAHVKFARKGVAPISFDGVVLEIGHNEPNPVFSGHAFDELVMRGAVILDKPVEDLKALSPSEDPKAAAPVGTKVAKNGTPK
jgi:hypothetical protein